jgi:hypothetical protein
VSLVDGMQGFADEIAVRSARLGRRVVVDPLELMAERAGSAGLRAGGRVSWGGGSRLMPCRDGWVAATLGRPTDWELVPALLELASQVTAGDWAALEAGVAGLDSAELRFRSGLLGLPLAMLGERRAEPGTTRQPGTVPGIRPHRIGDAPGAVAGSELIVADLSALWAGPLVGRLLASMGARVTKVESVDRPDGARRGDPEFFQRLNGAKASRTFDFDTADGRRALREFVSVADVVITACRPRALEQLGLDAEAIVHDGQPRAWVMISGYGQDGSSRNRVAFGDDAAIAGGLVGWDGPTPSFFGDAAADPVTGLAATAAVLAALESEGAWIIDASMADIAGGLTPAPGAPTAPVHAGRPAGAAPAGGPRKGG